QEYRARRRDRLSRAHADLRRHGAEPDGPGLRGDAHHSCNLSPHRPWHLLRDEPAKSPPVAGDAMSEAALGGLKAVAARSDGAAARLASFAQSCVASSLNLVLTLVAAALIWVVVPPFISWAVLDAAWRGTGGADCPNKDAACWIFVWARFGQIVYGSYPAA